MKNLIHDYKELTVSLDGVSIIFFINSGLCLDKQPHVPLSMHSHYHNEIFCVCEGEMLLETKQETYRLTVGDAIIIPMNLIHRPSYSDDIFRITVSFLVLGDDRPKSRIYDRLIAVTEANCATVIKNSLFLDSAKRIVRYFYGKYDFKDELITACLTELVSLICQPEEDGGENDFHPLNDSRNYRNYALQAYFAKPGVDKSFAYGALTLEELSRLLNLSPKQTQRTVQRVFGRTFREHIVFLKMKRAAELLKTTNLSVNEISSSVGYSGTRSFFSAFRREFGMTPGEYRHHSRRED